MIDAKADDRIRPPHAAAAPSGLPRLRGHLQDLPPDASAWRFRFDETDLKRGYVCIFAGRGGNPIRPAVDGNIDGDRLIAPRPLRSQNRLQVTIGHSGEAPVDNPSRAPICAVREQLRALIDGAAIFNIRTRADAAREIVIDIPT